MGKHTSGGGRRVVSARRLSEAEQDVYMNPRLAQETPEQRMELREMATTIKNLRSRTLRSLRENWVASVARQGKAEGRNVTDRSRPQMVMDIMIANYGEDKARAAFAFNRRWR